jgi:hypothetical protein
MHCATGLKRHGDHRRMTGAAIFDIFPIRSGMANPREDPMAIRLLCFTIFLAFSTAANAVSLGDFNADDRECASAPVESALLPGLADSGLRTCSSWRVDIAESHMRCPAVNGAYCDDLSHACCLVNNVYKCCPSLDSDCCKE